jgi:WD40 repeat protein
LHERAIDILFSSGLVKILVSLTNNVIEAYNAPYDVDKKDEDTEDYTKLHYIDLQGHRSDVRTLTLSSDDGILASASQSKSPPFQPIQLTHFSKCRSTQALEYQD